ncbi:flagellar hook-length control protein FliK [Patulibacter defluvii]|uniref:flagellar hook-length control protein FliK n=1 Tax=Patulibacter defluvii TaxID=3095358 RepID=UPI002A761100|nr:flagellar hook-length control protein FliK [Patulibacter sp. DM4]
MPTVAVALQLLAGRRATLAQLHLRPAALGGVEVRLRHGAQGLEATVLADSPDAARALQQASGELRRQLEAQGLHVARLDVGAAAPGGSGPDSGPRNRASGRDRDHARPAGPTAHATPTTTTDPDFDPRPRLTLPLPGGARVDVLA